VAHVDEFKPQHRKKKIKTIPPTIKQVVSPYFFFSAGDETLVSVHARKVLYN
jgi:hypothetical protein